MPHPPVLRAIQQLMTSLQQAGHQVVEWKPHEHKHAGELFNKILAADGGAGIRSVLAWSGEAAVPNIEHIVEPTKPVIDLVSSWELTNARNKYQKEYLDVWQERSNIDAWIMPVAPHAAVKHDDYKYYGYTTIVNVLDWSAVTIPVTFADKDTDHENMDYRSRNELDEKIYKDYNVDVYDGAPVGIQLIGRRLQEEYLIGLAEQIGEILSDTRV